MAARAVSNWAETPGVVVFAAASASMAQTIRPMPKFPAAPAVSASAVIHSGVARAPTPIMPSPPAALTAAARRPPALPAMGAPTRGRSIPQILVRRPPSAAVVLAFVCWSGCW
ncbi:MAG: hypothetical protein ACTH0G_11030 [Corynebacterium variabile]